MRPLVLSIASMLTKLRVILGTTTCVLDGDTEALCRHTSCLYVLHDVGQLAGMAVC